MFFEYSTGLDEFLLVNRFVKSKKSDILWSPSHNKIHDSMMMKFILFLSQRGYLKKEAGWKDLYKWSIDENENFWSLYLEFSKMKLKKNYNQVLEKGKTFQQIKWFPGALVNFSENLLRNRNKQTALSSWVEGDFISSLSYDELYKKVSLMSQALVEHGVKENDRICALMPNVPETIIAMLAVVSIGAVWSSCSPDFGEQAVFDRFAQIEPVLMFVSSSVVYKGKVIDCTEKIQNTIQNIKSIKICVVVDRIPSNQLKKTLQVSGKKIIHWSEFIQGSDPQKEIDFVYNGFDHPVFIMFSSGTTGLPKCIVQGSGVLLNHNKEHSLHCDITKSSTVFFYTTCGWMMWNWLVSVLYIGAKIILYDGNPIFPKKDVLWEMAQKESINIFGCSPKYLSLLEEAEFKIDKINLNNLHSILTTGAPMTKNLFNYVYKKINKNVQLSSIAGGTDLNGCFALGNPLLPIISGEIQSRGLGMAVEILDDNGNTVLQEEGELVCKKPFPSMPLSFWNDPDGNKYKSAYFSLNANVWYHGDFAKITINDGIEIYGRSDATLNPGGVRIGTADIYNLISGFHEIEDSIIISQPWQNDVRIVLFLKMFLPYKLDEPFISKLKNKIKSELSPRHVPEIVLCIEDIPYTHNGKKMELAVKKTIMGKVITNTGAIANPESLNYYRDLPELK